MFTFSLILALIVLFEIAIVVIIMIIVGVDLIWVFCTDDGTPLDESRVRKAFSQALRRAKLPSFRTYDLRHTYASLLLAQGAPITYVSSQLGQTDATTTLR